MTPDQLTQVLAAINAGISQMQIGNAVVGGTANRVLYVGAGPVLAQTQHLTWQESPNILTLGTTGNNASVVAGGTSTLTISGAGGARIVLTTGNNGGVQIGSASTDLIGFYTVTGVAQPTAGGVTAGFTAGVGAAVLNDSTFTGNVGATAYTIGDIVAALKTLGLINT